MIRTALLKTTPEFWVNQLLQRKAELEREHDALERALGQASSFGQRREAADRVRRASVQLAEIEKDVQPILAELKALNVNAFTAGAGLAAGLITPYTSPTCPRRGKRS